MDDAAMLELAADLAWQAAAVILAVRAQGFAVVLKADASPVTEADGAAERAIVAGLGAATPGLAVVAEEAFAAGVAPVVGDSYWLVDPLDGTREFAAGTPNFTVNIGLVRGGAAVLGAVALPAYGELFAGRVGLGAWKQTVRGGPRMAIAARPPPPEGLTVMASHHYAGDPALAALLAGLHVAKLVNIGSAVKICRLAEGVADYYPRLGPTMEWDTAAPQAVLEAAGGSLCGMAGAALGYGKPGWRNPPFVCRGR